jgi:transcriptional regulator with XRE-family HTH domain
MAYTSAPDFGVRLKAAREAGGVSLKHIASVTKISVPALEALERNDISRLPGGIFTRAFVRGYALEIGLDPEETVRDFLESFPHESLSAGHPRFHERDEQGVREYEARRQGRRTRLAWVVLAVLAIAVYLVIASLRGSNASDVDATAIEATASAAEHPMAQPVAAPAAVNAGDDAVSVGLDLELTAQRPCWVSATVDGKRRSIERLLEPGQHASLHSQDAIVLTVGDAAALQLTINGAPARVLGRAGQVVTIRVDPGNYRSFLAPR